MDAETRLARTFQWIALAFAIVISAAIALSFSEFCCREVSRAGEWMEDFRGYGYELQESPAYLDPGRMIPLFWVDNDRVLFGGHTEQEFRERYPRRGGDDTHSILIWNTRTNQLQKIDDSLGGECYFEGFLMYDTKKLTDQVISKQGRIGQLVEVKYPARNGHRYRPDEDSNYFDCTTYRHADLGEQGNCLRPLLSGDGFIDPSAGYCEPKTFARINALREVASQSPDANQALIRSEAELREKPVLYYRSLSSEPVALPILSKEASFPSARYVEWSRQYVVIAWTPKQGPGLGHWPAHVKRPIYLLSPGGRVEKVDMPWEAWNHGDVTYALPTRAGLFIVNHSIATFEDPGKAGLYLIEDGQLRRALRGYITSIAVGPDGCKLAIGLKTLRPVNHGSLGWINVCERRHR